MNGAPTRWILLAAAAVLGAVLPAVVFHQPAGAAPVTDMVGLRAAITAASSDPTITSIELVNGTTYSISGGQCAGDVGEENANASGDLDLNRASSITIFTPPGAPATIEMACPNGERERILHHFFSVPIGQSPPPPVLSLRNIRIRGGRAPSGSDGHGGGVLALGAVVLDQMIFDDNQAGNGDDGTSQDPAGNGGFGGAVAVRESAEVHTSVFTANVAGNGGNGFTPTVCAAAPASEGGDGAPGGAGGALGVLGSFDIEDSTFANNRAGDGGDAGDGLCGQAGGRGGSGGFGGAASCGAWDDNLSARRCEATAVAIAASTFSANVAGDAGDGGDGGQPSMLSTSTGGNPGGAGGAGGGFPATLTLSRASGSGGAVAIVPEDFPPVTLTNSTFDGNASGAGGAGGDGADGAAGTNGGAGGAGGDAGPGGDGGLAGAILVSGGPLCRGTCPTHVDLVHLTVTENGGGGTGGAAGTPGAGGPALGTNPGTPGSPGATAAAGANQGGSVAAGIGWRSFATVIGTASPATDGPDCWTAADSAIFSKATDNDPCGFGATNIHPFSAFALGPLADNGGPTFTREPGAGSVLIDFVPNASCTTNVDQRGVPRPQPPGGNCDVGAVEVFPPVTLSVTKTSAQEIVERGTPVTFTIRVTNTGAGTPQAGVTLTDPNCGPPTFIGGDTSNPGVLDPGETWTYRCTATPGQDGPFTNTATATVLDILGREVSASGSRTVTVVFTDCPRSLRPTVTGTTGTSGNDVIFGTNGPDTINAGAGNDIVCAFAGDDVINLGSGDDRAWAGNGADLVRANSGADAVTGEGEADRLEGGTGNDRLVGTDGAGGDVLDGAEGTDNCPADPGDTRQRCEG